MGKEKDKKYKLYEFYILSLVRLTKADFEINLKEKIQAKAFIEKEIQSEYRDEYYKKYLKYLEQDFDQERYDSIVEDIQKNGTLNYAKKRRFIYNLAQIAQAKGQLNKTDYREIIYIAGKMGIDEVSTHNIIDSVFSITNTFIAIIGVFCIGASLYFARALMIPLSLGYFVSRLIIKEQDIISKIFFNRKGKIFVIITKIISMLFTFAFLLYMFLIGFQAIYEMGSQMPVYWDKLNVLIENIDDTLQGLISRDDVEEIGEEAYYGETFPHIYPVIGDYRDIYHKQPDFIDTGEDFDKEVLYDLDQELEYQFLEGFSRFKEGITQHEFSLRNFLPRIETLPIGAIVSTFVGSLFNFLAFILLIFLFAAYLVFSDIKFSGVMLEMDEAITTYIATKFLISFLTGIFFYIAGVLFGLDFPFLWGFLAFLLNFIPSIGSVISTIPPIMIGLITFPFSRAIIIALVFIIIQNLMGYVIEPLFMGKTMMINPVAVLAGLIFWGVLWGIPGMLMSAPLMALIKLVAENYSFSKNYTKYL